MRAILERIRGLPRRTLALAALVVLLVGAALVLVLADTETLLGLLGLAAYVVAVLLFAAAVTFAVVKISPAQSAKEETGKGA
jgi:hypothetical protein